MKYLKVLFISLVIFLVSACGGGGGDGDEGNATETEAQSSGNLASSIYGLWQNPEGKAYVEVTENTYTLYEFVDYEPYGCYEKYLLWQEPVSLLQLDATNNVLTDPFNYVGFPQKYIRASFSDVSVLSRCYNTPATGEVTASITFVNLPEAIQLYHPETSVNRLELNISVGFDANNNGVIDRHDVAIAIRVFKKEGATPRLVPLNELTASLMILSRDGGSYDVVDVSTSIEKNTIKLHVNKSDHYVLTGISQGTQIRVDTDYRYGRQYQDDDYPGSESYTYGVDTSHLVDATGDAGQNAIFDIADIEITVTD